MTVERATCRRVSPTAAASSTAISNVSPETMLALLQLALWWHVAVDYNFAALRTLNAAL